MQRCRRRREVEPAWQVCDLEVADEDLQPVTRVIGGEDRGQVFAGLDRDHMPRLFRQES
jgi:hypothetical protein